MFIEVQPRQSKTRKDKWHIKVCENVRINGQPRKKVVRTIGVVHDASDLEQTKRFAAKVIEAELAKRNPQELLFDANDSLEQSPTPSRAISDYRNLREEERRFEGVGEVFGALFNDSGFATLLPEPSREVLRKAASTVFSPTRD